MADSDPNRRAYLMAGPGYDWNLADEPGKLGNDGISSEDRILPGPAPQSGFPTRREQPSKAARDRNQRPANASTSAAPVPQLRFITTTNPKQEKDPRHRKIVRSHVAEHHHIVRQQAWKAEGDGEGDSRDEGSTEMLDNAHRQSQQALRRSSGSLITHVGPGGSDPFASGSLEWTPRLNVLVDHFLTVVGPRLNAFITQSSHADPMKTVYIPFSISDPCVFHGLLLLSARSFAQTSGDSGYHITALTHKFECIRLVNEALGIPGRATSDAIVAAVMMLAVEELILGNLEVFKTHLKGLQSVVKIRGGLYTLGLGGILQYLAVTSDRACQLFTGSEPLFPLPKKLLEPSTIASLPRGFHKILHSGVNQKVIEFVDQAKTTTLVKMFSGYEGTTESELAFSDTCCSAIAQHVDQMFSHLRIAADGMEMASLVLVEESLCYGLSAYQMMMLRSIPPDPCVCFDVGNRLKTALMQTDTLIHWRGYLELLLWITFIGAHTTTQGPLRVWYLFLLNGINDNLGTQSWEKIKTILKSFLWNPRCEVLGLALWLEVEHLADQERVIYPLKLTSAA